MSHSSQKRGDHDVICDRCGFRFSASQTRVEWTNYRVCNECYDEKHERLDIRTFTDKQQVDNPRPPQPARFRRLDDNRIVEPNTDFDQPVKPYDPTDRR